MNTRVIENYSGLKYSVFLFPSILLLTIFLYLFAQHAININGYINIQKEGFYFLNSQLSQFPNAMYNLTQFGDALIFLSLLSVFIFYAPELWKALIPASLLSMIISTTLKNLFTVPRPAAALDTQTFFIIGELLSGHSSLPSGHSITIFTTLTILLFAFMPQKLILRFLWVFFFIAMGIILAITRVGVGAHFPLDVIIGGILGYFSALAGIFISRKYAVWTWLENNRFSPVLLLMLLVCFVLIVIKMIKEPLPVYGLTLAAIFFSIYTITNAYFKK
jgi:membrane-associated phospholipid phosphatase